MTKHLCRARFVALLLAAAFCGPALGLGAPVRITSWNLEWFPNGRPEEAPPAEQARIVTGAADVLRRLNPDIILLQEIKDEDACLRLAEAIKPGAYKVAVCSRFREGDEISKQQLVILAKEPAQAAWSEPWRNMRGVGPPRGFAFAWFNLQGRQVGVYSVHLKSNRLSGEPEPGRRKTAREENRDQAKRTQNISKREVAVEQLLTHIRDVIPQRARGLQTLVIGGDFNTTRDQPEFQKETTLPRLTEAGFRDAFEGMAPAQRVTLPGGGFHPDATFDYLFIKNATSSRPIITISNVSDHRAVTVDIEIGATVLSAKSVAAVASPAPEARPPGLVADTTPPQDVQVWVHVPTRLYFPPGATLYGRTSSGVYMKESAAIRAGYKRAGIR